LVACFCNAQMLQTGLAPRVWFEEGSDRDTILRFRQGVGSEEEFLGLYNSACVSALAGCASLPATTNVNVLEPLLVEARVSYLQPPANSSPFKALIGSTSGSEVLRDRALAKLAAAGLGGSTVLFVGQSGAAMYGLDSDQTEDFVGVFVAPLRNVLGFARNRIARVDDEGMQTIVTCKNVSHGRGMVLFELSHFAALFQAGNHRFLEQLYLKKERQKYESDWWKLIEKNVELFLGKQAIEHYVGCLKVKICTRIVSVINLF
jgi:hypothetical protein